MALEIPQLFGGRVTGSHDTHESFEFRIAGSSTGKELNNGILGSIGLRSLRSRTALRILLWGTLLLRSLCLLRPLWGLCRLRSLLLLMLLSRWTLLGLLWVFRGIRGRRDAG
jgi:hypothetical protein